MLHQPEVQPAKNRVLSVRSGDSYRVTGSIFIIGGAGVGGCGGDLSGPGQRGRGID